MYDCPMENHHPARQDGPTIRIPAAAHQIIHEDERAAVSEIFKKDGLSGDPGAWSLKQSSSFVRGSRKQ